VQSTVFSPRLQHAVRLLQMSSLDYAQALQEIAYSNPFVEIDEAGAWDSGAAENAHQTGEVWEAAWCSTADRGESFMRNSRGSRSTDMEPDALQQLPSVTSLRAHLHHQLGVLRLTSREQLLAHALVESLDDDGYLRCSLDELAAMLGETGDSARHELRTALCRLQALDPCGVAARDVGECLRLQLMATAQSWQRDLSLRIVEEHMHVLATRDIRKLAKVMNTALAEVQTAVDGIRALDARPGSRYASNCALAIRPDVTVRKLSGTWTATLNASAMPQVRLHKTYAALFENQSSARQNTALKGCLDEARWTLHHAAQRVSTILKVSEAIVARQKRFLEWGPLAMKPLGLQEIADAVGVHPSTVSRTVHNKYMSTPTGVYELQYFFSRGLDHVTGGASAPVALQQLIRDLIAAEPQSQPLSDAALARELARQGFRIARRTVTKYRQSQRIDPVELRRRTSANTSQSLAGFTRCSGKPPAPSVTPSDPSRARRLPLLRPAAC
jgi:RNA polymerase sigma-54 factor